MNLSISNSKRLLPKSFLIAFALIVLTIIIGTYYLIKTDAFPAPMFTGRVSLDEKLRFIRQHKPFQVDFAVLGSSTALSNMSSELISSHPEIGKNYFNFAAWGMTISHTLEYWKFLETTVSPKIVILYINLFDFEKGGKMVFNHTDIKHYIDGASPIPYYLKYHKKGFTERIKSIGRRRKISNDFDTLKFDRGGGALFTLPEDKISENDWTEQLVKEQFVEENYVALDDLLKILNKEGTLAIIVQGPLREKYSENNPRFAFLKEHWERVELIAKENETVFLNMHGLFYPDESLFTDTVHLNEQAAHIFTQKLLEWMEKDEVFQKVNEFTVAE